jgi:hypothetical protein
MRSSEAVGSSIDAENRRPHCRGAAVRIANRTRLIPPLTKTKMNPNGLLSGVGRVKGRFESRQPSKTIENHPRPHSQHQKVQTSSYTEPPSFEGRTYLLKIRGKRAKRDRNALLYEFDNYSEDNLKTIIKNRLRVCG